MTLKQCLICEYGGKVDMNRVPCSQYEKTMNIYTVKDCEHFKQVNEKALYVLMTQISNIAGLHEMSTPLEVTLKKIEGRIVYMRELVGEQPDI